MKFLVLIFFLLSPLNSKDNALNKNLENKKLEFFSEYATYSNLNGEIILSTSVIINNLDTANNVDLKIKTDHAYINLSSSNIKLPYPFRIETSSALIEGENGFYNFKFNKGEVYNGKMYYDRFILKGKKIDIEDNKYIYKNANITTCNLEPAHYHIYSTRMTFKPKKYFLAYNNIFFLGKIPVIYFPILYKPLGEGTPVLSQFYPGYDEQNGFYIKSNYTYKLNRATKVKLFVDYFSKKGFGFGSEVYNYRPSISIFDLSYYRINEYGDGPIYWGLNGGVWYRLYSGHNRDLYFQSYMRMLSDPDFNNNYFRSNPFTVSNDKQADLSLTYRLPSSYLRLNSRVVYKSYDSVNFVESENINPKIEYTTMPRKIKFLPFNYNYYISFENSRYANTYFQKRMNYNYNLYNTLNLSRRFSVYQSASYYGYMYFSTSTYTDDKFISKYGYVFNMRYSTTRNIYELKYNGLFRSKRNKLLLDNDASDKGVEASDLSLLSSFINRIDNYLRLTASYDLKSYTNRKSFRERLQPLSFEYYKNYTNYELYFKEVYDINEGHKSFITQMNSYNDRNYLNVGFANYSTNKEEILISNTFGYLPSKKLGWFGEFVIRYSIDITDSELNFFDKEVIIYKDFHDFRSKFMFRIRKDVKEFFFYITMKMNDPYRKDKIDRQVDEYFKPWRKFDEERDY